jgi:hypothetical protein
MNRLEDPSELDTPARRGTAIGATVCAAVLLSAVLVLGGCWSGGRPVLASDPGAGDTIADSVYRRVDPQDGERATAPNPDLDPERRYLTDRLWDVCDSDPRWHPDIFVDDSRDTSMTIYDTYVFADGSRLVFVETLAPGPHGDPPAEDTGRMLEGVELYRPRR